MVGPRPVRQHLAASAAVELYTEFVEAEQNLNQGNIDVLPGTASQAVHQRHDNGSAGVGSGGNVAEGKVTVYRSVVFFS